MNTKEKILEEAFQMFSVRGYTAVSIRDIAKAVGIKESSVYNHFQSKQNLFDSIVKLQAERETAMYSNMNLLDGSGSFSADEQTLNMYQGLPQEQFEGMGLAIFRYYLTDETSKRFRRMLALEQYRNTEIASLYRKISFEDALLYQSKVFGGFIAAGFFKEADPYLLALEFFSPAFLLLCKYENQPERYEEAQELFIEHIRRFNQMAVKGECV